MKISIDDLVRVISRLYPDLEGGKDFGAHQTLNDKLESNLDATITDWPAGLAQPSDAEILAELARLKEADKSSS